MCFKYKNWMYLIKILPYIHDFTKIKFKEKLNWFILLLLNQATSTLKNIKLKSIAFYLQIIKGNQFFFSKFSNSNKDCKITLINFSKQMYTNFISTQLIQLHFFFLSN